MIIFKNFQYKGVNSYNFVAKLISYMEILKKTLTVNRIVDHVR